MKDEAKTKNQLIKELIELRRKLQTQNPSIYKSKKSAPTQELKETQKKYQTLFNNSNEGIFLHDLNGKIIDINKKVLKLFGYTKSEMLSLNVRELHHPDEFKKSETAFRTIEKEGRVSFEINFKKKNGKIFPAEVSSNIITVNNQKIVQGLVRDITDRKKAEEKLKESENKYRNLFENNLGGVYVSTTDGKILNCNKAFANMMGYSSIKDVLQTPAVNFHQSKNEREIFIKKLKAKKELINFETKTHRKNGAIIYTIENVQLIGENILLGTIFEITDLKKTEEALKITNEFNESLIETIPFGMDIVDMEGNILFMNDLLKDAIGNKNPKGKCWEFYKDNRKQCTECPLKEEMELGEMNISEVHNVLGGREYEITHTTMNFENKKAMLEIFKDITEKKNIEKKILQLSRAIEQSPEVIVLTDIDGNIEYVNPKVEEVTGYTNEELVGKNPSIFKSGETPKSTYEDLWETILSGHVWKGELLNKRKDNTTYWESEIISPIINEEGNIINFIAIKDDITEIKTMREELISAKEKAEEISELKSNFLANMSHELRTPMVGILGFSEILKENIGDNELKEYAELLYDSGSRLLESLNLILNLTKIEADKIEIERSEVDVITVVKRVINLFRPEIDKKKLYINFKNENDKLLIETDERMLDQIVNNLVSNAVKFSLEGGITISAQRIKNNEHIEIVIKDTGVGIHKDKQEIIWEEFRQASEGAARLFEGTGLGLTITNNFTKKLGGEILLESDIGKGSTFTVLLPITGKIDTIIKSQTNENEKIKLSSILLVDDDSITRDIIKRFLHGLYTVDFAFDGLEGIEKAKINKYDIILMDINLKSKPGGVEVTDKIRELKGYENAPIIAVTAYAMVGDREKYLQSGFTDYLSKPFIKNDLIKLVNNYNSNN